MESGQLPNPSVRQPAGAERARVTPRATKRLVIPSASGRAIPVTKRLTAPEVKQMLSTKAMKAAARAIESAERS